MRALLAAIALLSIKCQASSLELMCGINKVAVSDSGLMVDNLNSKYLTSKMDSKGNVFYIFDDGSSLRSTQKGRVSLKHKNMGWQSCYAIVYYRENKGG